MTPRLSVGKADCPSPHSLENKLARVAWAVVQATVFRMSPRMFFGWRRFLLRCFGARIGRNARISPTVRIWGPWNLEVGDESSIAHSVDCYSVDRISIGAHATVSQYAFLCTASHDITDPHMGLTHSEIRIGDSAWICAGVFVAPGVYVSEGAVCGAYSVVTRSVPAWAVVVGSPARTIGTRTLKSRAPDQTPEPEQEQEQETS